MSILVEHVLENEQIPLDDFLFRTSKPYVLKEKNND